MNLKKKLLQGGIILSLSQFAGQFCSLARNIIIARIVSPADFGISSIFIMVVVFLEMMSNLSLDRLLVQSSDGNTPRFQQTAQFLQSLRGIVLAALIFFSAPFLASLFSIPEAKGAFYALALVPLFTGFCHLDPKRMERDMRFWPGASVELASQFAALLLAWPVGQWFGDYRAMLVILLVKQSILMTGTQIVAVRKYRWAMDKEYFRRFLSFGGPLLINGLLMFGIIQGDRFIMGGAKTILNSNYDMTHVGFYSAAVMITMTPALIVSNISGSLIFPVLSKLQNSSTDFIKKAHIFNEIITIIACLVGGLLLLFGEQLLLYVYGEQYRSAGIVVSWLGILWSIRILRVIPSGITIAKGNTKSLMFANFVRFLSLAGILFVVASDMNLIWVAIVGTCGEIAAYSYSLILNKQKLQIPFRIHLRAACMFITCLMIAALLKYFILSPSREVYWSAMLGWSLLYFIVVLLSFWPLLSKQFNLSSFVKKFNA